MPASKARRLARAAAEEGVAAAAIKPDATGAGASTAWEEDTDEPAALTAADLPKKHDSFAARISCTLFVGQLPYTASAADVRRHFKTNGVTGGVQVRLRTERDGKSKGTAFVEFDSESDVHTALRLHHSVMSGRRINVERTVGGGGANADKRKEKLSNLRERQGHQMQQTVDVLIKTVLPTADAGRAAEEQHLNSRDEADEDDYAFPVTQADVDERVRDFLTTIPTQLAEDALREAKALHMGGIRNRAAYLMGVLKRKVAESDRLKREQQLYQQRGATKRGRVPDVDKRPPPTEALTEAEAATEEPKPKKPKKAKAVAAEEPEEPRAKKKKALKVVQVGAASAEAVDEKPKKKKKVPSE